MIVALRDVTSRHDAGRSLYGRSKARLPTGPASWPTRQGTSPIMVLKAQGGCWLLPTSWPDPKSLRQVDPDHDERYRGGKRPPRRISFLRAQEFYLAVICL